MSQQAMRWMAAAAVVWSGVSAQAAERVKANNADDLNLTSSWVGGSRPGWADSGLWNNTVTGPNAVLLGGDMSLLGLRVTNPGGAVTIGGASTLTTSFEGFNLSAATQNLTLNNQKLSLMAYAGQIWDVADGRVLAIQPEMFERQPGASIGVRGLGTVASTALANDATGIIAPWAYFGTGTGTRYASMSGGNVIGRTYAGAENAAAAADVTDTTGTVNYNLTSSGGTLGPGASFNTVRYTSGGTTIGGAFTANGLLNAGSGTLVLSGAATIGAERELVLTAPDTTRQITLSGTVGETPGYPSGITITGGGRVNLTASNSYSGITVVNAGQLHVNHPDALGSPDGHTVIYSSSSSVNGGQLVLKNNINLLEPITLVGRGDAVPYHQAIRVESGSNTLSGAISLEGGSVRITAGGAGSVLNINAPITRTVQRGNVDIKLGASSGRLNVNAPMDLMGNSVSLHNGPGTVRFNVGGHNIGEMRVQWGHVLQLGVAEALPSLQSLRVGDGSTSGGSSPGTFDLNGFNQTVNALNGDGGAAYPPATRVVTNTAPALSVFTIGSNNSGGTFNGVVGGNLAIVKTGTGTQNLRGPNHYSGGTTVNNGTLVLSNAVNHGALTVNGGTFRFPPSLTVNGALSGTGGTIDTGDAASVLTVDQAALTAFAGALSGSGALVKEGAGTLTLSGSSSFSGGTTVAEGGLVFAQTGSQPATGTVTVQAGAGLGLGIGTAGAFSAAEVDALWANTLAGVVLDSTAWVGIDTSRGDATYGTSRDGTRRLVKTGGNTLTLTGVNTYTGGTEVQAGVLSIPATSALPGWDTADAYAVWPDAALAVGNAIGDGDIATIRGTGNFAGGACFGFDTSIGDRQYDPVISNTTAGALGVYKIGVNTLTLTGDNSYDGNTFVAGGVLVVRSSTALGSANGYTRVTRAGGTAGASYTDATGQVRFDGSGGDLVINENFFISGSEQFGYHGPLRNIAGNNVLNGTIRVGPSGGRISMGSGNLVLNGAIRREVANSNPSFVLNPSAGTLTISNVIDIGTGTFSLHSGAVNYLCVTGHTWGVAQVQYGNTLRLGVDDAMPTDRPLTIGNSTPGNGTLDLFGHQQTIGRLQEQGTVASFPNNTIINSRPEVASTLTVRQDSAVSDTFGGRIIGAVSLVKAGAANSVLTLRGVNELSGAVTVQGGTLALDATGRLGAGCTNVLVTAGVLAVGNSAALPESVTLNLAAGGGAKVNLAASVSQKVGYLFIGDNMQRAGTYGSTASAATNKNDTYFDGTGVLRVLRDNSGTLILLR
jgi:autotransporter-associated beta strand protein